MQANRLKLENAYKMTRKALCRHIGMEYDSTLRLTDAPYTEILVVDPSEIAKASYMQSIGQYH